MSVTKYFARGSWERAGGKEQLGEGVEGSCCVLVFGQWLIGEIFFIDMAQQVQILIAE